MNSFVLQLILLEGEKGEFFINHLWQQTDIRNERPKELAVIQMALRYLVCLGRDQLRLWPEGDMKGMCHCDVMNWLCDVCHSWSEWCAFNAADLQLQLKMDLQDLCDKNKLLNFVFSFHWVGKCLERSTHLRF